MIGGLSEPPAGIGDLPFGTLWRKRLIGLSDISADLDSCLHQTTLGVQVTFIAAMHLQSLQLVDRMAQVILLRRQG